MAYLQRKGPGVSRASVTVRLLPPRVDRYRFFFFFQAEDGIRDLTVTGVQTCALPIYRPEHLVHAREPHQGACDQHPDDVHALDVDARDARGVRVLAHGAELEAEARARSEERV